MRLLQEKPDTMVLLGAFVVTVLVELGALNLGWWWVTVLVGLAVAVALRGLAALGVLLVGTLLAWAGAMLWQSGSRTGDVADLLGAIIFNSQGMGWLIMIITFCWAALLALVGAWVGAAVRRTVVARRTAAATSVEEVPTAAENTFEEELIEEQEHV